MLFLELSIFMFRATIKGLRDEYFVSFSCKPLLSDVVLVLQIQVIAQTNVVSLSCLVCEQNTNSVWIKPPLTYFACEFHQTCSASLISFCKKCWLHVRIFRMMKFYSFTQNCHQHEELNEFTNHEVRTFRVASRIC